MMTTAQPGGLGHVKAERRQHLELLSDEAAGRLGRGQSLATWAADIGFWVVFAAVVGVRLLLTVHSR